MASTSPFKNNWFENFFSTHAVNAWHFSVNQQPALLKFSEFSLYKAKDDGITIGGFYKDKNKEKWLLKEGHYYEPVAIVKEYVAGGIYQLFLGDNAPRTEMVINDFDHSLLIGSKLLNNFNTLSTYANYTFNDTFSYTPYGKDFPTTVHGKALHGFMDAIWAIQFMHDTDGHSGNVGLIDCGTHYNFAKIDHGFSFNFYGQTTTLDDLRSHLSMFYSIDSLEKVGFDEIYQGLTHITEIDFSNIENLVSEKMSNVKTYMQSLDLKDLYANYDVKQWGNLETNIQNYKNDLIHNLQNEHLQFKKIANYMSLEKALIEHDADTLIQLTSTHQICLNEGFKPFYNPTYANNNDYWFWHAESKSVTGVELGQKYWPELFNGATVPGLQNHTLEISDILSNGTSVIQIDNPVLPLVINPVPLVAPIVVDCI